MTPARLATHPAGMTRPGPLQWIWYTFGGRLGPLHGGWVLHDTTCRTRWLRQVVRTVVQTSIPAVIVLVVLRFSWIAWAAVALGLVLALWYSIAYINLTADERLVRHGYDPGTLHRVLSERNRREHADQIVRYMKSYRSGAVR